MRGGGGGERQTERQRHSERDKERQTKKERWRERDRDRAAERQMETQMPRFSNVGHLRSLQTSSHTEWDPWTLAHVGGSQGPGPGRACLGRRTGLVFRSKH